MPIILDGRLVRAELKKALVKKVRNLVQLGNTSAHPTLAIIQVGDRPDSRAFISSKRKFAEEIGVQERHIKVTDTPAHPASQKEVIAAVTVLNEDPSVHGIIVQLPLPIGIDGDAVLAAISAKKDVDGLTATNVDRWLSDREEAIWPATARGIRELLAFYKITLAGKHVVVVGRSSLVGKPVAAICLSENATVTICHSHTVNLAEHTRRADILIVAIGSPRYIGASHVKKGVIVIDIGINSTPAGFVGDVDFDAVKDIVASITPVPGGVGQMTVLALFENLIDVCYS